eukprot:CAMPEP_0195264990 /NCGR_PEP_ID=MMETSP0706-20130129/11171_1 /TAXON_ID=33640 /ORGANISM="Asterionellopsis glacialis, Strain CCMP134" /LENGTH=141 /DNA_ID=CAMNT_0040319351 /DNA_START=139 /DNA_END=564 /DNA_ORIENTATION=+
MTTVYKALSAEEQSEVYMQAVGQSVFSSSNSEFCQGSFGMCSDTDGNPWWNEWNSAQRDVYFFYRGDVDDNDWKYYCTYSMNSYESEFGNTIDELYIDRSTTATHHVTFGITIIKSNSHNESNRNIESNNNFIIYSFYNDE